MALTEGDFERVTLVDLPTLANYGPYELLGRLAYGGMAEIFLARELGPGGAARRMMVVKRVLPHVAEDSHFVDMFRDEARLAMQLNHPQICHVYTFGEEEGTFYLAMEWVNGMPLSKIIRRARQKGGIPVPIALKIIAQVAEALDYAHRASDPAGEPLGIVHRDVSPQNIMVSYDGVVKLLDFGIAKASSHSTRTEAGVIKGKFAYMSPQQCVGEPIDARADIFALGTCLFETLAGKNPFRRKTEFETMTRIVGDPTPDLAEWREGVPPPVLQVIETCLMKQPEARYQTAGDMQLALEAVIPTLGVLVNASRLGDYVSTLFAEEVQEGPHLDTRLQLPPTTTPPSSHETGDLSSPEGRPRSPGSTELDAAPVQDLSAPPVVSAEPRRSGSPVLWIALVLVAFVGLGSVGGVGAWFFVGGLDGFHRIVSDSTNPQPTPAPPGIASPSGTPNAGSSIASPSVANPSIAAPPTQVEPPPAPAVVVGTAFVESSPPGATLHFGDRGEVGTTPMELTDVAPGTYDVRLSLDGHRDYEGQITVTAGARATLTGELRRAPRRAAGGPPGEVSVNTRPWSKVYVGRRLLGTTPIGRAQVPSGNVRLRLVDRDGVEHRRTLRVPPGEHVRQSYDLRE